MQLTFRGANQQVTGSQYCLEVAGRRVLVDCGLFQEREHLDRNWADWPWPPHEVSAVLLTHIHTDHSALLPRLVRDGFRGPIYATDPTCDLAEIVLRDSARIQSEDADYKRRRHAKEGRHGRFPEQPLYDERDAERTLPRFRPVKYLRPLEVHDGLTVTFHDAGHVLGSAMLTVEATENGRTRRIVFSGDIGQWHRPLIRDPSLLTAADYLAMESTYGDRDHDGRGDVEGQLGEVIRTTAERGGKVVIPTFAVERAQELMYHISRLVHSNAIPDIPIYLDSPMAVDVTEIFRQHPECFDAETHRLFASGEPPLRFPGLTLVRSTIDSQAINRYGGPCVIMASSGMCNAGRIKHHLRHQIGKPENTILFVGYQAHGTLGRQILEGAEDVRILGRSFRVRADVQQITGFSGHADRTGLLHWLSAFRAPPRQVFLTHGERDVSLAFADLVREKFGWNVSVPEYGSTVTFEE